MTSRTPSVREGLAPAVGAGRVGGQPERASRRAAGGWGEDAAWRDAVEGRAVLTVDVIRQLARRVDRLEEILELFRDEKGPIAVASTTCGAV